MKVVKWRMDRLAFEMCQRNLGPWLLSGKCAAQGELCHEYVLRHPQCQWIVFKVFRQKLLLLFGTHFGQTPKRRTRCSMYGQL